jgi:hypothetical protein
MGYSQLFNVSLQDDPEQLHWIDLLFQNREYYEPDQEEENNPLSFPSNHDFAASSESHMIFSDGEDRIPNRRYTIVLNNIFT